MRSPLLPLQITFRSSALGKSIIQHVLYKVFRTEDIYFLVTGSFYIYTIFYKLNFLFVYKYD